MAEMLVDSTKLDACLDAEADAIRAKTGGSADIPFDYANNKGFADAIAAIPSGGGTPEWLDKVSGITFSLASKTVYGDVEFDFGSVPVEFSASRTKSTIANSKMIVRCGNLTFGSTALSGYNTTTNITDYIFYCSNNPAAAYEFTRSTQAHRILTPGHALLVTSFGNGNYRKFNGTSLQEFYLVPNKVTAGEGGIVTGVLIDDSLVSVANALVGGLSTPQTLTISNATTKAKCSTIVGSVSQITDASGTYDFFTQDQDNGTVTLLDFITNTKGWTVA